MSAIAKALSRLKIVGGILRFLWKRKLYWLIPFMIILIIFAIFFIFAQTTGVGPFIYTLF